MGQVVFEPTSPSFSKWCRCHPQLVSWFKIFKDLSPIALITSAPSMAFIYDNKVKEVWRIFFVETRAPLIFGDRLIGCEINLTALVNYSILNLPAGVPKWSEGLIFRIIDQDVSISQIENFRAPVFSSPIPTSVPELPADLEGNERLASSCCHC